MNVLVAINKGYLRHFYVMLTSLLDNTQSELFVYVMHDDLEADDKERIKNRFSRARFSFIFMEKSLCAGFPTTKRYPYTIYYRIFAPLLLPKGLDRVLYLDCDLVVHNPIDEFYGQDFQNRVFVACSHTGRWMRFINRVRLGGDKDSVYMNTGVLLMNLTLLRELINVEKLKEYTLRCKRRLVLFDQDVLYAFFGNQVLEEDSLVYNLSDRQIRLHNWFHRDKITADWVEENNVIAHYIGRNKPWKKGYKGILDKYYQYYKKLSEK